MLQPGQNRDQLELTSLDLLVSPDSIVRVIDAFVDMLNLEKLGIKQKGKSKEGRPAFSNDMLLKLYLYGYLNRVRSSRRLAREAKTNMEAIWLVRGMRPCYKTIADFRKENGRGFRKVFRNLNKFLRQQGLLQGSRVAVDGSKFRAQNSKKNNYNEKKVKQHLDYIEKQTKEYLSQMDKLDQEEAQSEQVDDKRIKVTEALERLKTRKTKYDDLSRQIEQAHDKGVTQVSTIDPDARALPKRMNIVEVSYNNIITTDANDKLITNFEVTNEHDSYALAKAARKAKVVLGKSSTESITALADRGFDTGHQLQDCHTHNIDTLVALKKRVSPQKSKAFNKEQFIYSATADTYSCPASKIMKTNGNWYKRGQGKLRRSYNVKRYTLPFHVCNGCPYKLDCAGQANLKKSKGRYIERSEYQGAIDQNTKQVTARKAEFNQRQAIVEHPFGTIKRGWGYDYTLMRTIKKVEAEFSIIFTCYNLRRAVSLLGVKPLIEALKSAFIKIWELTCSWADYNKESMQHILKHTSVSSS